MSDHRASAAALVTLALAAPVYAQRTFGVADFLSTIGGTADVGVIGSSRSAPLPDIYPLRDDGPEIIGSRFFVEKLNSKAAATAERARGAFAQECAAKGGRVEPENSAAATTFHKRTLWRLPPDTSFKYRWAGISAVCSRTPSEVMGGFVAVTYDPTVAGTRGDAVSWLVSRMSKVPTRTSVYAYAPALIRSADSLERERLARDRKAEEQRQIAERGAGPTLATPAENLAAARKLSEPGTSVCRPLTRDYTTYRFAATVEGASRTRLQLRAGSISVPGSEVTNVPYANTRISPGVVFWDDAGLWSAC